MSNRLLIDASVWLAALDPRDPVNGASRALVEEAAEPLLEVHALDLTIYEAINVAACKWRSAANGESVTDLILEVCPGRLIRVDRSLVSDAVATSLRSGLTAYDASYVAAARRHSLQLVSIDFADLVGPGHAIDPEAALAQVAS